MARASDHILNQAQRLIRQCERAQVLLRCVLDWTETGLYDPVDDLYAMRLPGDVVRQIRGLLQPQPDPDPAPAANS